MRFLTSSALAAVLAAPGVAMAQTDQPEAEGQQTAGQTGGEQQAAVSAEQVIPLNQWRNGDLYAQGFSADDFIDEMEVYGQAGDDIGDVEDIIVDSDGRVVAIVAEIGGLLDIGDTHVAVPWDQVDVDRRAERVTVPLSQENVRDYDPFTHGLPAAGYKVEAEHVGGEVAMGVDDVPTGERAFRVSELIGDYARVRGHGGQMQQQAGQTQPQAGESEQAVEAEQAGQEAGVQPMQPTQPGAPTMAGQAEMMNYGYVSDVIISNDRVAAVIVEPRGAMGVGSYAYPYFGYDYGWEPGDEYYDLPYTEEEVSQLQPFEYGEIETTGAGSGTD